MNRHGWCMALRHDGRADFWFHDDATLPPAIEAAIARELSLGHWVRLPPLSSLYGSHLPAFRVRVWSSAGGRTA